MIPKAEIFSSAQGTFTNFVKINVLIMIALSASLLYSPTAVIEQPLVLCEDGRTVDIGSRMAKPVPTRARLVDLGDAVLAPGFIDLHIHGGAGHDVMENDDASLPAVETLIACHGVTAYFPTTVTASLDYTLAALERLASAIEEPAAREKSSRARPLGIHLEGPFISHARRGVHPPQDLLAPSLAKFERLWQAARGHIKMMTIAPELEGAAEVIAEASRRGVCVSLGHSDADMAATRAGVLAGARHATHTFNAMRPLDHREPGILGEVLTNPRMSADIIADGIHVNPTMVKLFLAAKGQANAILITDSISATGMPDGRYHLGSFDVEVKDGRCLADGKLAGSVLTMDRAIRNVMRFAGWDLQQAIRLATGNPARVAGLDRGKLETGCHADIVVLSPHGEVRQTIVAGAI
jgi:N-acetylglucosamine-6-phosphate deacetylase